MEITEIPTTVSEISMNFLPQVRVSRLLWLRAKPTAVTEVPPKEEEVEDEDEKEVEDEDEKEVEEEDEKEEGEKEVEEEEEEKGEEDEKEVEEEGETGLEKETRKILQTHDSQEDQVLLTREPKLWGCAGAVWTTEGKSELHASLDQPATGLSGLFEVYQHRNLQVEAVTVMVVAEREEEEEMGNKNRLPIGPFLHDRQVEKEERGTQSNQTAERRLPSAGRLKRWTRPGHGKSALSNSLLLSSRRLLETPRRSALPQPPYSFRSSCVGRPQGRLLCPGAYKAARSRRQRP